MTVHLVIAEADGKSAILGVYLHEAAALGRAEHVRGVLERHPVLGPAAVFVQAWEVREEPGFSGELLMS